MRVRAVITTPVSSTSVYIGNYFELTSGITRTYYYAGSVRVAERYSNTLYYLLTDRLGSTAVTTDASGNRATELRYYPYGDSARYNPGGQITTYRFTGQRWDSGTGLYFYNARWYDPYIGRFLAPDTIVPSPGNPQALNRYSYTLNNPFRYTDPTGHWPCRDGICEPQSRSREPFGWVQLPSQLTVTLADLQHEPDDMLLVRVSYGEGGLESGVWVAASILVRASENLNGAGTSIRAQVMAENQYDVMGIATGTWSEDTVPARLGANIKRTMDPTVEQNGAVFRQLYAEVQPMYDAVMRGNFSALPAQFQGPDAYDSFGTKLPDLPQNLQIRSYESKGNPPFTQVFFQYPGTTRSWPWSGMDSTSRRQRCVAE